KFRADLECVTLAEILRSFRWIRVSDEVITVRCIERDALVFAYNPHREPSELFAKTVVHSFDTHQPNRRHETRHFSGITSSGRPPGRSSASRRHALPRQHDGIDDDWPWWLSSRGCGVRLCGCDPPGRP